MSTLGAIAGRSLKPQLPAAGGEARSGFGTVFKLTPPAAGKTLWNKALLYAFTGGADGAYPNGGLILDDSGALYGTTNDGGGGGGPGKLFKLTPGGAREDVDLQAAPRFWEWK